MVDNTHHCISRHQRAAAELVTLWASLRGCVSAVSNLHSRCRCLVHHPTTPPPAPLLSSTLYSHLPNLSTSRLLTRLPKCSTLTRHSQLASYLCALERSTAMTTRIESDGSSGCWVTATGAGCEREQLGEQDPGEVEDELNDLLHFAVQLSATSL